MTSRYEIRIGAVPRSYRDKLDIAIEGAGYLKMRNLKEEVIILDAVTQQRMLIVDDHSKPEWREPLSGPIVRPV